MSDDLISKSELLKKTRRMYAPDEIDSIAPIATNCVTVDDIYRAAVVDAVPGGHGRWIEHPQFDGLGSCTGIELECSNCHERIEENGCVYRYCPNCGAKMDGGADNA